MKNVLGIIGSPRKLGNCEIMVKEISRQIAAPHELCLLRLTDFNLSPCRACYKCLADEQRCDLPDDFNTILDALTKADALIVAAPTYYLGANSCLKRFLDRGLAFYAHIEALWQKPAVGVGIAGISGKEGYTLLNIESFLKLIMARIQHSTIIYGALPGEIFLNPENKAAAKTLAAALFGTATAKKGPHCPLCGGDTFRFLDSGSVRCMLCSESGRLRMKDGQPLIEIDKSEHALFLTRQDVTAHKAWLLQMKERFLANRKALKSVTTDYLKLGTWITPR